MASSKETYCLCGQPYNIGQFMIECDCCREWFHGSCVDVKIYHSDDIDKYHCPKCAQTYGPSVLKIPTNNHRADRYELGAETRPSQVGTPAWVRALAARPLRPAAAALQRMRGQHFTEEFVRDDGFNRPIIFNTSEGLDIKTPNPGTFTVRSVLRYCGAQMEVEVIDVRKQSTLRMTLGDFIDYFETPPEHRDEKVLNVLSLEFSDTNMAPLVEPPAVIRRLDWAERAWPASSGKPRPSVQKYCLMSPAGAYTDFHVDFGGTTVWYHVLHGRKIFYLVPPTATNLALYQQWSAANNQNEKFFGDMVEWYGTTELCAGQTLCIPSGWVHAVLTPCDSLVFGGNLLHSYAIEMQLQIYEIERRVETPTMFRYPLFEAVHWYAAAHLLTLLRRHNEESQDEEFTLNESSTAAPVTLPALLLRGLKILARALKEWHQLKASDASKRDNVPKCLNSGQLVRELCKELRTLEKNTSSLKDKDFKIKSNTSPNKSHCKKQQNSKKSLKLTLPKPIVHMAPNGHYPEEKIYADKFFIDNKEVLYNDVRYMTQEVKYANGIPEQKYVADSKDMVMADKYPYQNYEEQAYDNGYLDRQEKKTVLKIKMNHSPSSSREEPPPYNTEHSILKSHLIRNDRPVLKPIHQWTISKKDIGDYHEEQILFTNENLQANMRVDSQDMNYGPGMYSAEDIQPDYQYSETAKPGSYQPEYGYHPEYDAYQRYDESHVQAVHQGASYTTVSVTTVPPMGVVATPELGIAGEQPCVGNGEEAYSQHRLPSYDAAVAHQQYAATNVEYTPEEPKAVRRSERPVRRRVSNTYDYEDGDLYIDDAPAPRRRRARPRPHPRPTVSSAAISYRQAARSAPANGIESLIQASVLADGDVDADADQPARATEDAAVAGMLSISEQRYTAPAASFGLPTPTPSIEPAPAISSDLDSTPSSSKRTRKPLAAVSSADEDFGDEEDVIKEVHRDEEYVYPSLELSSDEEEDWSSTRRRRHSRNRNEAKSKSEKDECWSPRARVGRVTPRNRGPVRAGVRRECVRAALHHAALHPPPPPHPPPHQNAKRAVIAAKSKRPPPPVQNTPNNKNSRLKKGMKTAKQRLGKILKIHKMIY